MGKKINVLSDFDGKSCGRVALERAGINVGTYYASEVNKYAIQISEKNFPHIVRMGDITKWREWDIDWSTIDLVMGGSPCQGFSNAGKQGGTKAEVDGETIIISTRDMYLSAKEKGAKFLSQSYLFWEFVLQLDYIRSKNPNVSFMLENVQMSENNMQMITGALGVEPVMINSSLVSAQNRVRYYWANWLFGQPNDKGIVFNDISQTPGEYIKVSRKGEYKKFQEKLSTLTVGGNAAGNHSDMDLIGQKLEHIGVATDINGYESIKRIYSTYGKIPTLQTHSGGNRHAKVALNDYEYRRVTPIECERAQTLPDNFTEGVSPSQRYTAIGNGWTVDVIAHILSSNKSFTLVLN